MAHKRKAIGTLEAVLAIVLWGISFITIKIALEEVTPVTLIVIRFTIGAVIISLFTGLRGEWRMLNRRDLPSLALVGAVGITLQQLLQVGGQALAPASVAGLLAATAPAFTLILAAIFLHERQTWKQITGVLLALGGSAAVITNGQFNTFDLSNFSTQGSLLVLLSAIVWAIFTILSRNVVQDKPAILVTSVVFIFGVFFTLPLFLYQEGWREFSTVSVQGWMAILFTAILCTGAAYLLNNQALKFIPASQVAIIQMLEPLVVVVTAVLVLSETISVPVALGAGAILGGVFLAQSKAASAL